MALCFQPAEAKCTLFTRASTAPVADGGAPRWAGRWRPRGRSTTCLWCCSASACTTRARCPRRRTSPSPSPAALCSRRLGRLRTGAPAGVHALAGEGSSPLVCCGEARPCMRVSQRCLLRMLGAALLRQAVTTWPCAGQCVAPWACGAAVRVSTCSSRALAAGAAVPRCALPNRAEAGARARCPRRRTSPLPSLPSLCSPRAGRCCGCRGQAALAHGCGTLERVSAGSSPATTAKGSAAPGRSQYLAKGWEMFGFACTGMAAHLSIDSSHAPAAMGRAAACFSCVHPTC